MKTTTIHRKFKQKIYSHTINKEKHADFLSQERQDSITHEVIVEGDEVVFCAVCKSVFMADSWEYIGRSHCDQSQTLKKVPVLRSLSFDKKKIEYRKKKTFYKKHIGGFLMATCVVFCFLGMVIMGINGFIFSEDVFSLESMTLEEANYIQNGNTHHEKQNYESAKYCYERALGINPNNTEAKRLLVQLENEYLLALEKADHFFQAQNYQEAKNWYKKATLYKPNSDYPKNQLILISEAQAEAPTSFIKIENVMQKNKHSILKEFPKELEELINKDETLYFWVKHSSQDEYLLSYESGLIELKTYSREIALDENGEKIFKKIPKEENVFLQKTKTITSYHYDFYDSYEYVLNIHLSKTFRGKPYTQAVFVYPYTLPSELLLHDTQQRDENYEFITVINSENKIDYYLRDNLSTFYFKKHEKVIFSDNGKYFLIQNTEKTLNLYHSYTKTLIKSLRTNEHKPFLGDAYFDLENNEIVAHTEIGESRWKIGE